MGATSILGELSLEAKRCLFVVLLKSIGICVTHIDVQTRPFICRTESAQSRGSVLMASCETDAYRDDS